ncbi:unnamed protein product, partial [Mesocestoides corti]
FLLTTHKRHQLKQKVSPGQFLCLFVVKQGVSDAWYSSVIVGGIALTGFIFYIIIRELFSSKSPTRVYEDALKICISDSRVQEMLGPPITGRGEPNRRGRRTHVASTEWIDNKGKRHMAMRFFLKGVYNSGTVHLEIYENDTNDLEYRYLIVEVDGLARRQVILRPEESRSAPLPSGPPLPPLPPNLDSFEEARK